LSYTSFAGPLHELIAIDPIQTINRQCTATDPCNGITAIDDTINLRMRYDSLSKTLVTEFDPNGGRDSFVNLSTTTRFVPSALFVFGQSINRQVTSADDVYADSVVTTAAVVPEQAHYAFLDLGVGLALIFARGRNRNPWLSFAGA